MCKFKENDIVKSCPKLESGLRLGQEGIHACALGPFSAPLYWTAKEAAELNITKEMISEKRRELFEKLNDDCSKIVCKNCKMVVEKKFKDVDFTKLGHIDVAACTICNLRCNFCGYVKLNLLGKAEYDPLAILKSFQPEDVLWSSAVDFNGGEPTLLPNFEDYIEYFNSRKIRIFLYTNSVLYKQAAYDGLADGSIRWICTSLDAGTPSTFWETKERNTFNDVLENLTRYADAGSKGGGELAVKYIFTEDNSSDDDVTGFVYAMLAIRPQQIWLTFDFEPLNGIPGDSDDFGGYDYSKHINAYVKTFLMLKKHGIIAGHFTENHLAEVGNHGKILMRRVKEKLKQEETNYPNIPELIIQNHRVKEKKLEVEYGSFSLDPFKAVDADNHDVELSLEGKKVLIVPTCNQSICLLSNTDIKAAGELGLVDRSLSMHGRNIEGSIVHCYEDIENIDPDVILVSCVERIEQDILNTLAKYKNKRSKIYVNRSEKCEKRDS
jgi:hypothetical protein